MNEYIERTAVHELVKRLPKYHMFSYDRTESLIGISPDDVDFGVDKIPAADVAPVRHGRWMEYGGVDKGFHYCSECKRQAINCEENGNIIEVLSEWCPACGALMDGKVNRHEVSES